MEKKKGFRNGFIVGVLVATVLFVGIVLGFYFTMPKKTTVNEKAAKKSDLIEEIIDSYYFGDVKKSKLVEGTYKGMVAGLDDPYSEYYTKKEYKSQMEEVSGKYAGIGALVSRDEKTGIISIQKIFKGSPAEKSKLKEGDIIAGVNGKDVTGEELSKVVMKIKGKEGTTVKIKVLDKKTMQYKTYTVKREIINIPTVESKIIDKKNKIAYLAISEFDENTDEQFTEEIEKLKKKKIKGIVFDLRYNPGGIYESVCNVLDEILPKGIVVFTKDKNGMREEVKSDAKCLKIPMAVLQNEGSASASEIFTGAVQDFKAGTIVGTKSYGKGVVQQTLPFSDGTAIKLTTKKYYTPNGRNINKKGIIPDVKVENKGKKDNQLEKAKQIVLKEIKK